MLGTRNRNGKRNAMTWYSSITYFNLNWINTSWQVAMNYSLFYFSIRCFLLHDVWLVDCLCLNLVKYLNKVGVIFWIQYNCKTRQLLSKHAFTLKNCTEPTSYPVGFSSLALIQTKTSHCKIFYKEKTDWVKYIK